MAYVKDPMSTTGLARSGATSITLPNTANNPAAGPGAAAGGAATPSPARPQPQLQPAHTPMSGQALASQAPAGPAPGQMQPGVSGFGGQPNPVIYKPGEGPVVNSQNVPAQTSIKPSPATPQPGQAQQAGALPPSNLAMFMAGKQAALSKRAMVLAEEEDTLRPREGVYVAYGNDANVHYGRTGRRNLLSKGFLEEGEPLGEKKADFPILSLPYNWWQSRNLDQQLAANNANHPGPSPATERDPNLSAIDPTRAAGQGTFSRMGANANRASKGMLGVPVGAMGAGLSGLGELYLNSYNMLAPESLAAPHLQAGLRNARLESQKYLGNSAADLRDSFSPYADSYIDPTARTSRQLQDLRSNSDLQQDGPWYSTENLATAGDYGGHGAWNAAQALANPAAVPGHLAKSRFLAPAVQAAQKLPSLGRAGQVATKAAPWVSGAVSGLGALQDALGAPTASPNAPAPSESAAPAANAPAGGRSLTLADLPQFNTPQLPADPPAAPAQPEVPAQAGQVPSSAPPGSGSIGRHAPQVKFLSDAIARQQARLATLPPDSYQARKLMQMIEGMKGTLRSTEQEQTYGAADYARQGYSPEAIRRWQAGPKGEYENAARQFATQNPGAVNQGPASPNAVSVPRPPAPQIAQQGPQRPPQQPQPQPMARPTQQPAAPLGKPPTGTAAAPKLLQPPAAPKMAEAVEDFYKCATAELGPLTISNFAVGFYLGQVERGASAGQIREAIKQASVDPLLAAELQPLLSADCPLLSLRERWEKQAFGPLAAGVLKPTLAAAGKFLPKMFQRAAPLVDDAARAVAPVAPAAGKRTLADAGVAARNMVGQYPKRMVSHPDNPGFELLGKLRGQAPAARPQVFPQAPSRWRQAGEGVVNSVQDSLQGWFPGTRAAGPAPIVRSGPAAVRRAATQAPASTAGQPQTWQQVAAGGGGAAPPPPSSGAWSTGGGMAGGGMRGGGAAATPRGSFWGELGESGMGGLVGYGAGEVINAGADLAGIDVDSHPVLQYLPMATMLLGAAGRSPGLARLARKSPWAQHTLGTMGKGLTGRSAVGAQHGLGTSAGNYLASTGGSMMMPTMLTGRNWFRPRTAMNEMVGEGVDKQLADFGLGDREAIKNSPVVRMMQAYQQGGLPALLQAGWGELTPEQQMGVVAGIGGPLAGIAAMAGGAPALGALLGVGGLAAGTGGMLAGAGNPAIKALSQYGPGVTDAMSQIEQAYPGTFQQARQLPRSEQDDYIHMVMKQFGLQPVGQELRRAQGAGAAEPVAPVAPAGA